jgi:5-methyltetrahydrofolate--homocysteine methyltransferase
MLQRRLARQACDEYSTPDKPRFVAGALGPTPKTASISLMLTILAPEMLILKRFVQAYYEQVEALVDGGVDLAIGRNNI